MGKIIICHCEDISLDELHSAIDQGYADVETIKRYTGIATGTCQGKCCLIQALRVLERTKPDGGRAAHRGSRSPTSPPPASGKAGRSGVSKDHSRISIPTIRQPTLPLRIDEIIESGNAEKQEHNE
jgi:bacterioferritin-associated ferredoxin